MCVSVYVCVFKSIVESYGTMFSPQWPHYNMHTIGVRRRTHALCRIVFYTIVLYCITI